MLRAKRHLYGIDDGPPVAPISTPQASLRAGQHSSVDKKARRETGLLSARYARVLLDPEGKVVVVRRLADHRDAVGALGLEPHLAEYGVDLGAARTFDPERRLVAVDEC